MQALNDSIVSQERRPGSQSTDSLPCMPFQKSITHNYAVKFTVDKITFAVKSNQFNAQLLIQVNQSCLLSVPNHLFIYSSCSVDGKMDYPVNMTHLLTDQSTNQKSMLVLSHPLVVGKHNCTFTVGDEVGHTQTVFTQIDTFHTASYQLYTNSSCVYVQCTFIPGTMAEGCMIVVYNEDRDEFNRTLYPQSSSTDYVQLGPFNPGQYSLYIYDYINGTFNESADPAFEEQFFILANPPTSTTDVNVSSPPSPSATPSCSGDECGDDENSINLSYLIISVAVGFCFLLSVGILVMILTVIIIWQSSKKCGNWSIEKPTTRPSEIYVLPLSLPVGQIDIENGYILSPMETQGDPYDITPIKIEEAGNVNDDDTNEHKNDERNSNIHVVIEDMPLESGEFMNDIPKPQLSKGHNGSELKMEDWLVNLVWNQYNFVNTVGVNARGLEVSCGLMPDMKVYVWILRLRYSASPTCYKFL